ncbi:MAG TPA: DsbA family protein [Alphaproteobacteria bacterium]|nr:DsbA family protein [Alphaproteobacteria bacterium]
MRRFYALIVAALAITFVMGANSLIAQPQAADSMTEAQVEQIVEKMLRQRPELVIEALEAYKAREEAAEKERQKQQLSVSKGELFQKESDPFIGNADGAVTIVEFFDYRCGYCKRVLDDVVALADENSDLKIVFKEFPILGEQSVLAARVSLAVNLVNPDLYGEFHNRAMSHRGAMDENALLGIVTAIGGDSAAVKARMEDPQIASTIQKNYRLADQLGIRGTPAFIIGDTIVPGAASKSVLETLIEDQRG